MHMHSKLPLNHLNTFAMAAEHLSFQQAAQLLHVTPSAVSHQIRHLESLLGYKLFDRLDKRVALTRKGTQLFQEVREPLRQLVEASRRALAPTGADTLALSVAPAFATRWLMPRMRNFQTRHPEITLSVFATTEISDFRHDPFDAAIRLGDGDWPGTHCQRLMPQRLVAVCRPELLTKRGKAFTPRQLIDLPRVHYAPLPDQWPRWFVSAGIADKVPTGGIEVQNSSQALEAVQTGDAIALVDIGTIDRELESGRLAQACEHILEDDDGYYLVWPPRSEGSPALQALLSWLLTQVTTVQNR